MRQFWVTFRTRHPRTCDALMTAALAVRPYLPPINFITLHYAYFIGTTLIASLIFWGASVPAKSVGWWDSLFMCMSAMTGSGLNTVNLSQLTTFQQVLLCVLMMLGSQVLVSYITIAFRKHIFEKRFEDIVAAEREKLKKKNMTETGAVVGMAGAMFGLQVMSSFGKGRARSKPRTSKYGNGPASPAVSNFGSAQPSPIAPSHGGSLPSPTARRPSAEGGTTPDAHHVNFLAPIQEDERQRSAATGHSIYNTHSHQSGPARRRPPTAESKTLDEGFNVQTFVKQQKRNIGRNGQFFNLSSEQREYLGGVEYRALKFLSVFVIVYFFLWQLIGGIALGAWMSVYATEDSAVNAQNPWWAGFFLAISAYNNAGFTLLDAGFVPFQSSYFLLVVVTLLSLAGPAAFPVFMRLSIWSMSTLLNLCSKSKDYGVWKEGFDFILKFPRRVYTSMFPSRDTWVFVATFGGFVIADWFLILILSIGNPTMEAIPLGQRIFDALFEGFCKYTPGTCAWLLDRNSADEVSPHNSDPFWRIRYSISVRDVFRCPGSLAGRVLYGSLPAHHYHAKDQRLRGAISGHI